MLFLGGGLGTGAGVLTNSFGKRFIVLGLHGEASNFASSSMVWAGVGFQGDTGVFERGSRLERIEKYRGGIVGHKSTQDSTEFTLGFPGGKGNQSSKTIRLCPIPGRNYRMIREQLGIQYSDQMEIDSEAYLAN